MKLKIIEHKGIFISISVVLVTLAVASLVFFGLKPGIDFKSGSMWQVKAPGATEASIRDFAVSDLKIEDPIVSYDKNSDSYSLVFREISPSERTSFNESLIKKFPGGEEMDFSMTSPSVSAELKNKAIWVVILVLLVIAAYIAFAFRSVSHPIQSYKYGLVAILALAHDVTIAAGVYALFGHFAGITIDTNFVVALLTIAAFSVQDTIVIMDRVRENLLSSKHKETLSEVVGKSLNEVFFRSFITSVSIMLVLAAITFFGPLSVRYFSLTMLVGMFFGTYSSLFVASPLLVLWHELDNKFKK